MNSARLAEANASTCMGAGMYRQAAQAWMKAAEIYDRLAEGSDGQERREMLEKAEHAWRRAGDCCDHVANEIGRRPDRSGTGIQ